MKDKTPPALMSDDAIAAVEALLAATTGGAEGDWAFSPSLEVGLMDTLAAVLGTDRRHLSIHTTPPGIHREDAEANAAWIADSKAACRALLAHAEALAGILRDMQQDSIAYRLGRESVRLKCRSCDGGKRPSGWLIASNSFDGKCPQCFGAGSVIALKHWDAMPAPEDARK